VSQHNSREAVILSAARTPLGKFEGQLAAVPAPELGAVAIRAALERARVDPAELDEVLMGQVLQAGAGQAPARQAALKAGVPASIGASTINKVCGSGMKSVMLASQAIRAGDADCLVAGGMENMYLAPYALPGARAGFRLLDKTAVDLAVHDGLWCAVEDWHMGSAAEWVAQACDIPRQRQDEFALASHQKAVRAIAAGAFRAEIAPVEVRGRQGVTRVDTDESPRADSSLEALAKLRPAFQEDGTVTAGNAPGLNHGAAALVVAGSDWAAGKGLAPLARILGYAQAATEPQRIFLAPVAGVQRLLARTGLSMADFDLIEINEAFAAQVLADGDEIPGWDWEKVNIRGGAIALGHPIGASGARILVTLLHALRDTGGRRGLATACLGGGEAVALAVELLL
jgi:acetyl-CoA C-acetyltransferase